MENQYPAGLVDCALAQRSIRTKQYYIENKHACKKLEPAAAKRPHGTMLNGTKRGIFKHLNSCTAITLFLINPNELMLLF